MKHQRCAQLCLQSLMDTWERPIRAAMHYQLSSNMTMGTSAQASLTEKQRETPEPKFANLFLQKSTQ